MCLQYWKNKCIMTTELDEEGSKGVAFDNLGLEGREGKKKVSKVKAHGTDSLLELNKR